MQKHRHVFKRFATFDNIYDGYLMARKNKRYRDGVVRYTANLEENIVDTVNQLQWKTYTVGVPHRFYEYFPKKRIIHSLPFKDRVVNCAAYNVLWPIYERSFYEHSYGSIPGKGTLAAVNKLQYWMRLVQNDGWYIGKMDIAKFFFRVPVDVQMRELTKPLDDPDMEWFLETAIRCDGRPFGLPLNCTDVEFAEMVHGIGMQVGSLISQMTANVVLTPLDHFIKRELGVPYLIRYMDDMVILCPTKRETWSAIEATDDFLREHLGLQLNAKTAVRPIHYGVEFVGRKISPEKVELRRSTTLQMKSHLRYCKEHYRTGDLPLEYCLQVIDSYLGLMNGCNCDALRKQVLEDYVLIRDSDVSDPLYPDVDELDYLL